MITRWCSNNDSGRDGLGWDGVQWGTRCLGHRGAASIHICKGGWVQDAPAAWGFPTASERGAESEVAHKWARWLHNPCRLGSPPLQSGGQNQKCPQVGKVAT